ncbi:hypothetical protein NC652_017279 [Populus alba x Populus x berolinensis]|nr:hypothetical protein NC652_017279 [Populus alba x Populus x berolinensis]
MNLHNYNYKKAFDILMFICVGFRLLLSGYRTPPVVLHDSTPLYPVCSLSSHWNQMAGLHFTGFVAYAPPPPPVQIP